MIEPVLGACKVASVTPVLLTGSITTSLKKSILSVGRYLVIPFSLFFVWHILVKK
jgi:hypothetical protein